MTLGMVMHFALLSDVRRCFFLLHRIHYRLGTSQSFVGVLSFACAADTSRNARWDLARGSGDEKDD